MLTANGFQADIFNAAFTSDRRDSERRIVLFHANAHPEATAKRSQDQLFGFLREHEAAQTPKEKEAVRSKNGVGNCPFVALVLR